MAKRNIRFRTLLRPLSIVLPWTLIAFSCTSDPNNRPSPLKIESSKIGSAQVSITYSSPGVKGRKIFGGADPLVPYGRVWRTGANDATFLTLDNTVVIDSVTVDKGQYSVFTIPNKEEWVVILNREWDQWGSYNYDSAKDLLRLTVKTRKLDKLAERMKLFFEDDSLKFSWETTSWAIPLSHRHE